jgi:uncharacterized membrane protein
MSRRTNELVKAISPKKKQQPKNQAVKQFLIREVWESRPFTWTGILLSYLALAFTSYELAKYYVAIPEFNGIIAFVSTFVIGSRAFKK